MRKLAAGLMLVAVTVAFACQKQDDSPPANGPNGPNGAPSGAYGQPPPGGQPPPYNGPAPAGQPPPGYGGQPPAPGPGPAPVGPAQANGMAIPSAAAFTCSNDSTCGLAHCNTQYGKCAFPCANAAVDCIQGAACLAGFCIPKPPGQ